MNLDARGRRATQAALGSVTRVDPVAGLADLLRRRRRRRITQAAAALATATALAVVAWVGIRESEQITPIVNPPPGSLGRIAATIPVGAGPVDVLVSQDAVWVANAGQGTLSRIDPTSNTVTRTIRVGRNPVRLAAGFGSIWVANQTEQTLSRIDARTGRPVATISLPTLGPNMLAVGEGSVWAIAGYSLVRIDPATNKAAAIDADWELVDGGLTVAGGRVWLSGRAYPGSSRSCGWTRRPTKRPTRSQPPPTARWLPAGAASGTPARSPSPSTGWISGRDARSPRSRSEWSPST